MIFSNSEREIPDRIFKKFKHRYRDRVLGDLLGATDQENFVSTSEKKCIDSWAVDFHIDTQKSLSPDEQNIHNFIDRFCTQISAKFQNRFVELIREYQAKGGRISPQIFEKLSDQTGFSPKFSAYFGANRRKILEQFDLSDGFGLEDESAILVFNFPKPLAQYWWKGGEDFWGRSAQNVSGMAIEWGAFYRQLTPIIWDAVDDENRKREHFIERVNPFNVHDPKQYYYVWEVSLSKENA